MRDLLRFSKSIWLTFAFTTVAGILVFSFAYHLHRYTEILSGVIGGLTIILGMVIAEWLRSAKEQADSIEQRLNTIFTRFQLVLYNADFLIDEPLHYRHEKEYVAFTDLVHQLNSLATSTHWPQPNAKQVRQKSAEISIKLMAMLRDAVENDHLWSVEKRFEFNEDFYTLIGLAINDGRRTTVRSQELFWKFRETEHRPGMTNSWRKKLEEGNSERS